MKRISTLAALALLVACSPGTADKGGAATAPASPAAGRHPESGLRVIPLTIASQSGRHAFRVEVAATPEQQEKGLMFRTAMGADEGMIFPMDPPRTAAFWMRNTVIPLDIIYIGADRRILNIADAKPYDETPLLSAGKAAAVLELNAGRSKVLGIAPGDLVQW